MNTATLIYPRPVCSLETVQGAIAAPWIFISYLAITCLPGRDFIQTEYTPAGALRQTFIGSNKKGLSACWGHCYLILPQKKWLPNAALEPDNSNNPV